MSDLTPRQHELLAFLLTRARDGAAPATLEQLCTELGLASRGSLHKQIQALVAGGFVHPLEGRRTGVRLTAAALDDGRLPLRGDIAAGRPIEAVDIEDRIEVPANMRPHGDCYVLRVTGDSMIDDGILHGDLVVVDPRRSARSGDTVVALVDGNEVTLKAVEFRAGRVLLHPANPAFPTQAYGPERVALQGVMTGLLRTT
ncbi:MAG: transcriptional repressor LexA [Pseudomonadota bacterium]